MKYYNFHAHLGKTTLGESHTADMLVRDMCKYGIEKVGICNLVLDTMKGRNDLVHDAKRQYPDIIRAYMYVNFKDPTLFDEIDWRLGEQTFDGLKIATAWEGVRADHFPLIKDVMAHIAKYNKVVQIATGYAGMSPYPWVDIAEQFPGLQLCFTHIGGRDIGYSLIEAIRDLPNISVETSQNFEYFMLKKAVDVLGSKRVLMGTDWPYKPTNTELKKIEYLGLSDEQLEDIYYRNAARLWGEEVE